MALKALQSLRAHRPGRIRWALFGAAAAVAIGTLLGSYPLTYDQCLRWAASRPTAQGVVVARQVCARGF